VCSVDDGARNLPPGSFQSGARSPPTTTRASSIPVFLRSGGITEQASSTLLGSRAEFIAFLRSHCDVPTAPWRDGLHESNGARAVKGCVRPDVLANDSRAATGCAFRTRPSDAKVDVDSAAVRTRPAVQRSRRSPAARSESPLGPRRDPGSAPEFGREKAADCPTQSVFPRHALESVVVCAGHGTARCLGGSALPRQLAEQKEPLIKRSGPPGPTLTPMSSPALAVRRGYAEGGGFPGDASASEFRSRRESSPSARPGRRI